MCSVIGILSSVLLVGPKIDKAENDVTQWLQSPLLLNGIDESGIVSSLLPSKYGSVANDSCLSSKGWNDDWTAVIGNSKERLTQFSLGEKTCVKDIIISETTCKPDDVPREPSSKAEELLLEIASSTCSNSESDRVKVLYNWLECIEPESTVLC